MDEQPEREQGAGAAGPDEEPAAVSTRPRRSDRHRSRRERRRQRPSRPRAPAGRTRRSDVRRRRRRRWLTRTSLIVTALVTAAVVVLVVVSGLADRARELVGGPPEEELTEPAGQVQPTMAIVTRDEVDGASRVRHVTVLAHDRSTGEATVLLVPPSTVADVPGHGSFGVGEAFAFGDAALVGVTLENLLGIRLDEVVDLSRQQWAALLGHVGPYEIDVPSRLRGPEDDGGRLRFEAGPQVLDAERLAEYLVLRSDGDSELDMLPRVQQVLQGLLDELGDDPDRVADVLADAAPVVGVDDPRLFSELFAGLAGARAADRLAVRALPVLPLAADRTDAYRVDAERLEQLVDDRLAAARPDEEAGAGRSLQVLNGVGTPGVGQSVAERLQPGGYRLLLTGNADSFDYARTRIVIYDDSREQLAVARDIRERLGVGEIERSGMPQSVVDVTIIVGADLLDVIGRGGPPAQELGDGDAGDDPPGGGDGTAQDDAG